MKTTLKAIDFRFFIGCACYVPGMDNKPILKTIDGIDSKFNMVLIGGKNYEPTDVRPILRKFDMLSRHEVEGLNKLWPSENIKRDVMGSIKLDADIIDYLTSLNVDVFDWISQDLAIDAEYNKL